MQLDVLNIKGQSTGRQVELPAEFFGMEPNDHLIYLAVKQYLASQRQGTSKVKTRAEVQGASRKLHKQKGTGGARKGNIVIHCTKVVVPFSDQNHATMHSN
jgi:large subunit ribosomal protein L4